MKKQKPDALDIEINRKKELERIRRLMTKERFKADIAKIKQQVARGLSLDYIKMEMGGTRDYWDILMTALAFMAASPEKLFFEFNLRRQYRLDQALDLKIRAQKTGDLDNEMKAMMMLVKLDQDAVELADKLGLLKPEVLGEGEGYSAEQVRTELEKMEAIIRSQILVQGTTNMPILLSEMANGEGANVSGAVQLESGSVSEPQKMLAVEVKQRE